MDYIVSELRTEVGVGLLVNDTGQIATVKALTDSLQQNSAVSYGLAQLLWRVGVGYCTFLQYSGRVQS